MQKAKLGLIGIVNDEAKRDFWGTMQRVAKLGYAGIEGEGLLYVEGDARDNLRRFHDLGLQILTVSASRESLRDNLRETIEHAHALETKRATVWWAPFDSRESALQDAELFNEAGAKLAQEGITLCYHHHEHEFRNVFNGVTAFDLLVADSDPNALQFVVDIAWATFGGVEPAPLVRRLQGRIASLHVKDLSRLDERDHFTAVGTGVVKVQESVRAAIESGVEWAVVEQDKLRNLDAMETVTLSALYLREAGLV